MNPALAVGLGLWLILLVVLAVAFAQTARRMTRLAATTRGLTAYQGAMRSLADRTAAALGPVLARLDDIRRRAGDPERVAPMIPEAIVTIEAICADARALDVPAPLRDRAQAVIAELERILRALDLIDHGLSGLAGVRGPRELEIQTTLKRGALNLLHARDAIEAVATEAAGIRPTQLRAGAVRRGHAAGAVPLPSWRERTAGEHAEAGSDPSM